MRPSQCFVLTNSRIPLVRSSSKLVVHCTRKAQRHSLPSNYCHAQSTVHQAASSSFCSAQASEQGPLYPTLRANPFPKVTDLFCRLPLPTLLYPPEAANLGDLMRLLVRAGVRIMNSFGVSMTRESTPDTPENKVLCSSFSPITRQTDFRAQDNLKEKKTLPRASTCIAKFTYVTMQYPRPG